MRTINPASRLACALSAFLILAAAAPTAAHADLIIDKLVVELRDGTKNSDDLVIWNDSAERAYVLVEPSRIEDPGTPSQKRASERDPRDLGLLASPQRLVLEPGQQRLLRMANLKTGVMNEDVYRVTVRPVVNEDGSDEGLQLLVGYDLLVLVRPQTVKFALDVDREGKALRLRNDGNASVELLKIRQCTAGKQCTEIAGKRLYSGMEWSTSLEMDAGAELFFNTAEGTRSLTIE